MKQLSVGIVGCGLISKKRHIPGFLKNNKIKSISVCDLNMELAQKTANDFGLKSAYRTVDDLIKTEKPDIIDICTPPQAHAAVALQAIENDCNVLMEKPMALNVKDCDLMISAAKKRNVKLCTVHNNLFHQPFLEAKKLYDEGKIGDFTGMRIFLSTPKNDLISFKDHWVHKLPGGIIGETGPHITYMSLAFLKNVFKVHVTPKKHYEHTWAPYDEFIIELEADNGISTSTISYTNDYWAANVDLFCSKEVLHLDLQAFTLTRYKRDSLSNISLATSSFSKSFQVMANVLLNGIKTTMGKTKVGHDVLISKYVDAIINNEKLPVTTEDARKSVSLMELISNQVINYK